MSAVEDSAVVVGVKGIRDTAQRQAVYTALCIALDKLIQKTAGPGRCQPHKPFVHILMGGFLQLSLINLLDYVIPSM